MHKLILLLKLNLLLSVFLLSIIKAHLIHSTDCTVIGRFDWGPPRTITDRQICSKSQGWATRSKTSRNVGGGSPQRGSGQKPLPGVIICHLQQRGWCVTNRKTMTQGCRNIWKHTCTDKCTTCLTFRFLRRPELKQRTSIIGCSSSLSQWFTSILFWRNLSFWFKHSISCEDREVSCYEW